MEKVSTKIRWNLLTHTLSYNVNLWSKLIKSETEVSLYQKQVELDIVNCAGKIVKSSLKVVKDEEYLGKGQKIKTQN